jgi:hypothetical protein
MPFHARHFRGTEEPGSGPMSRWSESGSWHRRRIGQCRTSESIGVRVCRNRSFARRAWALARQSHSVGSVLPAAERNPLFEVFKRFCPTADLEEMFTKAGAQRFRGDQSAAFEQHVAWLLSLLGYRPIVLGPLEHLKSERIQILSIDIIAGQGKALLLVACTLMAPKSEDFTALWHLTRA